MNFSKVEEAVAPVVNDRFESRTIVEGHNWGYFSGPSTRTDPGPLRVGYTTWKSTIGDRVADAFAGDSRFAFNAIREAARWSDIRELYHSSDVFLATPGPEEGFYLPGLEAMAANNVVVSPFVGGNKAYLRADDGDLCIFGGPDGFGYAFSPEIAKVEEGTPPLTEVWRVDCNPKELRERGGVPVPYTRTVRTIAHLSSPASRVAFSAASLALP